ncbi:MAG: hypothetical protein NTV34_15505 [Proteobacteria bacterium]|nr:hypothetical protein [Pseudomonadota bacterium]
MPSWLTICFTIGCLFEINSVSFAETYQDLKPVLEANCTRCHNADGLADFLPFESFNEVKPQPQKMAEVLTSGRMPKDNPEFKNTPEGARLLKWLTSGDDLYAQPPPDAPQHPILKDPRELKYADLKPIIVRSCTGCHNPNGQARKISFATFEDVSRRSKKMLRELLERNMPRGDPDFRFSKDGRALIGWLEFGRDLGSSDAKPIDEF